MAGHTHLRAGFQTVLNLIYPPTCLTCDTLVEGPGALCAACWAETPFITGLVCDLCGAPMPGDSSGVETCDDCLRIARPWAQGRAALVYRGNGRKLVMALKHGDRTDIAPTAAQWMARAARPLRRDGMIVAPVPLHWTRFLRRRFNQSALLAQHTARLLTLPHVPDLLTRPRRTAPLEGLGRDQRFARLQDAITATPRHAAALRGRPVLLVDDVMTSGATLAAASEACLRAGASEICVLTLARVVKDA